MSLASKSFLRLVSYVETDRVKLLSPEFPCLMGPIQGILDKEMFLYCWELVPLPPSLKKCLKTWGKWVWNIGNINLWCSSPCQRKLLRWIFDMGCPSDLCILFYLFIYFSFIFISWRLITLQYCSGFCHTLTWISHGFTRVPHPDPPSPLPLHPLPLGLPSAPGPSTCLMHPTWAGDLFHPR